MYKVLGKKNCIFCERTKKLLKIFNIEFEYLELDKDFILGEFINAVPKWHRSFPAVFKGGEFVGGFTELKKTVFQD